MLLVINIKNRLTTKIRNLLAKRNILIPALVDTNVTFDDFYATLSKPGKKNYNGSFKKNEGINYIVERPERDTLNTFFAIWSNYYSFPDNYFNHLLKLMDKDLLFIGKATNNLETISIHLLEVYNDYIRCHAPWYNRELFEKKNLASYMWFKLIMYCIRDNKNKYIDLGGGPVKRIPITHYKQRYKPKDNGSIVIKCKSCSYMYLIGLKKLRQNECPKCKAKMNFSIIDKTLTKLLYTI